MARKFNTKADMVPPVKMEQKPWKPEPDMGSVKAPVPAEKACECAHLGATHYGGPKGWCNTGGCDCQEFKAKA